MGYSIKTPTLILPSNPRYNYLYDSDTTYSDTGEDILNPTTSYQNIKTISVDATDKLFMYFELDLHLRKVVAGYVGSFRITDDYGNNIMLQTTDYNQYADTLTGDYAAYESKKGYVNVSDLNGTENINFEGKANYSGRGDIRLKNTYLYPQKINLEV